MTRALPSFLIFKEKKLSWQMPPLQPPGEPHICSEHRGQDKPCIGTTEPLTEPVPSIQSTAQAAPPYWLLRTNALQYPGVPWPMGGPSRQEGRERGQGLVFQDSLCEAACKGCLLTRSPGSSASISPTRLPPSRSLPLVRPITWSCPGFRSPHYPANTPIPPPQILLYSILLHYPNLSVPLISCWESAW